MDNILNGLTVQENPSYGKLPGYFYNIDSQSLISFSDAAVNEPLLNFTKVNRIHMGVCQK